MNGKESSRCFAGECPHFLLAADESVSTAKAFVQTLSEAAPPVGQKIGVVGTLNPRTARASTMQDVPPVPWFRRKPLAEPAEISGKSTKSIIRGNAFHVTDAGDYLLNCLLARISTPEASAFATCVQCGTGRRDGKTRS